LLAVAGALAAQGQLNVISVIGAAVSGAFIADNSWYWIARRHGRRVLALLCKLSLSPDTCVRQTESLFVKVGPAALLFAKFIPGLGSVAIALSGITRVPPAVFMAFELIGASLYLSLPILLGWLFHDAVTNILNTLARLGVIGLAIVVGALMLYLFLRWWERMLFIRQLRMDRITVDELVNLLDSESKPILLDVRSRQARAGGVIPGAIAAHPEDMHPTLSHHDRDREIVVYCACPNEATAALAAKHLKKAGFKKIRPLLGGVDAWAKAGHKLVVVEEEL
jgi:membrane protein DedA with SNARE-associated domain/rhodanese-related sulfurtransferase